VENLRKQHVVDRAFQIRVATSLTAIAMLVPIVLLIGGYLVWTFAVIHDPPLADKPLGWALVGELLSHQWWLVLLFIVTFLAFSFALVFFYTHRIAGPVYRFRWLFEELSEGRIHNRVQLREGDCFENLAASILRANATLSSSITHLKAAAAAASQQAEALQHPELGEQIRTINHLLDRYSVVVAPEPAAETEGELPESEASNPEADPSNTGESNRV